MYQLKNSKGKQLVKEAWYIVFKWFTHIGKWLCLQLKKYILINHTIEFYFECNDIKSCKLLLNYSQ